MRQEQAKGFLAEFRKFITRGNVMDLAVGVIIGGAFNAITLSLIHIFPRNVRLSEAPSHGKPVTAYDGFSRGAEAYQALAGELMEKNALAGSGV